jgi:hypothetical protein
VLLNLVTPTGDTHTAAIMEAGALPALVALLHDPEVHPPEVLYGCYDGDMRHAGRFVRALLVSLAGGDAATVAAVVEGVLFRRWWP